MKRFALLLAFGVVVCGCDGHFRSFKPLPVVARTGAETTVQRQHLVDAVTAVAAERGYTRGEPNPESDSYTVVLCFSKSVDHDSVQMKLVRDTKTDAFRIVLIDWPSFVRSAESVTAEAVIRKKLDEH